MRGEVLGEKGYRLIDEAREISLESPNFQTVLGPGAGDHATNAFMQKLRTRAAAAFGQDYSEQKICGATDFAVDFFFPDEQTIVEVALGLPNPQSEYEKDILKAIMAQDAGYTVKVLLFISRAGAAKKCEQPGRAAVRDWALKKHRLQVEVYDLEGSPRKRPKRLKVPSPII
jgi:hypothetical protein